MQIIAQQKPDCSVYLAFTPDTLLEVAIASFAKRFGVQPEKWFEFQRLIWVGPIPEEQEPQQ